jgi:hypothetical protein
MVNLDCPAQRLLITALRNQIESWRKLSSSDGILEEERADVENDIGYAFTVLSELELSFFNEFGYAAT